MLPSAFDPISKGHDFAFQVIGTERGPLKAAILPSVNFGLVHLLNAFSCSSRCIRHEIVSEFTGSPYALSGRGTSTAYGIRTCPEPTRNCLGVVRQQICRWLSRPLLLCEASL